MKVHIKAQYDSWILDQLANHLEQLEYVSRSVEVNSSADINYFINYVQYEQVSTKTAAWFTHIEEKDKELSNKWWSVVDAVDMCIFHSRRYLDRTRAERPHKSLCVVSPGVDTDLFIPRKLRVGIVGRAYTTGRKGEELLQETVGRMPNIEWRVTGEGWGVDSTQIPSSDMPKFYQECDYVLVPSLYEGGPMSVLEAISCGVEVIAPPVGWVTEFPHISYPVGDVDALCKVLDHLQTRRNALHALATSRTWDNFVEQHDQLFRSLIL